MGRRTSCMVSTLYAGHWQFRIACLVLAATHFFGALSVVTYNHCKTATTASRITVMGLTLSKKRLTPGWDRSSIRKLIVGIGQSGRGGVGGRGMGKATSWERQRDLLE